MNRLSKEKSPYLLQHKDNPVDWYPWGPEAFEKARREDKPIFLSIGYSTCHWCHVMEHESFEDDEIAKLMNEAFVSVKVDREERPDIDHLYMTVCQMMTGGGGWPLTVVMTPDQRPFFAGTYFPKESRFGRIGMKDLIARIQDVWNNRREEVLSSADQVVQAVRDSQSKAKTGEITENDLKASLEQLSKSYDSQFGGFGNEPKFPTPHNLMFLLRAWRRFSDRTILQMVEKTLKEMHRGGIYDQLGYGIHRYSTDREWLVPHFEKMLYDQALVAYAALEAYQATGDDEIRKLAQEILEYVLRDMTDSEGGFYSAEDADSEGEEGKFYLWTRDEIKEILGSKDAELFCAVFNVREDGNWSDMGHRRSDNILHLQGPIENIAQRIQVNEDYLIDSLDRMKRKLFAVREERIRPHKDDKILVDWNGLMIAALAKGAQVLSDERYLAAAQKAFDFILNEMRREDGSLFHRFREGERAFSANLDDYAFLIWGAIELYQAGFQAKSLSVALELTGVVQKYFWDQEVGGYFFTGSDGEPLFARKKEIYDGAVPSGNSAMLWNLLRLSRLTGETEFEVRARELSQAFCEEVRRYPSAHCLFLIGADFALGPSKEVVVVGDKKKSDTQNALQMLALKFSPNKVLVLKDPSCDESTLKLIPYLKNYEMSDGRCTIFICENQSCRQPSTDVAQALAFL